MVLITSNRAKQLLCVSHIGQVRRSDFERGRTELQQVLAELSEGFRLLVDFTALESVDVDCAGDIGGLMELIDQSGVSMVVRVIPDPHKDIGMNILTIFHYRNHPRVVTCNKMTEAAKLLSL